MNFISSFKTSTNSLLRPLFSTKSSFYFTIVIIYLVIKKTHSALEEVSASHEEKSAGRFQVASFNFEHVAEPYGITLWILLGSLAKIGFHLSHRLTEKFPESCLLIILGLVVGGLFYGIKVSDDQYGLQSETFFLYLLPPIILEAGYFMPNRPFFSNVGTILLFAIVNTLFNTLLIGVTLWAFNYTPLYGGTHFEALHCFVFAALISAVDPVAVLATFVEIQVNDMLYIIVFGESLLNDAVSVVLYRMFDSFSELGAENLKEVDYILGLTSFFVVALGGTVIGIIFGIIGSYTTKFTEHAPVLEPLIVISIAYLSYLTAEMTSTSGILAITFCGMFMKQYVEFNISKKSSATIEYVLKMFASIMETIIFMFMGLSTVSDNHSWNTGFVIITILCCTIYRAIGVFIFANISNRWRLMELSITDMLIMSYGGIRGAVAFALALILDENKIPRKKEFVTATIAMVFFTVFLQGTTIGPVVKYLKVKRKDIEEPTMSAKLSNRLIDHTMSCLETIAGVGGNHSMRNKIRSYDKRFFKPILIREKFKSEDEKLLNTFKKINELNMNKLANNSEFSKKNVISIDDELNVQPKSPEMKSILSNKKTQSQTKFHELLENAMITPRRQTIVFDDELNDTVKRKQSRSQSVMSLSRRRRSLGALRYADNDMSSNVREHELSPNWKPTNRKSFISNYDEDELNEINLNPNVSFKNENSIYSDIRSKSLPRASSPNYMSERF